MSATNATANYNLPLFIGSDKPAWLTDWNGAMNAIDAAIAAVSSSAGGTATDLAALTLTVSGLSSTVADHTTSISTLTTSVAGNTGAINTINSLIGNGLPTTDDKTIIGAINEIYAMITGGGGQSEIQAANVSYDNTSSGLAADDVQEAIDELVAAIPSASSEVQSATIAAGSTTAVLTFTSQTIGTDTLIDVYTDDFAVAPSAVAYTASTVTITIPVQAAAVKVAAKVQN
mgnify:CR=1 FL=1